jgi:Icc-related predicted phosphoesterase
MKPLRVLALTDIHGAYGRVETILAREPVFDALIIGGDLTTCGTRKEAESALQRLRDFEKPLLVVAGNMDPPELDDLFVEQGISINGQGRVLENVGFFGVSAGPFSSLQTPNEVSEEEIFRRAEGGWREIGNARWKVFVPHAPPRGTRVDALRSGEHVGSTAVREFVERYQPDLTVCGHIHEARGEDVLGQTRVVNCGPAGRGCYVILEFGDSLKVHPKQ